jgi:hypothetical protein
MWARVRESAQEQPARENSQERARQRKCHRKRPSLYSGPPCRNSSECRYDTRKLWLLSWQGVSKTKSTDSQRLRARARAARLAEQQVNASARFVTSS